MLPPDMPSPSDLTTGTRDWALEARDFWLMYDHQVGRWCVQQEDFAVIRTGAVVIHTREVTSVYEPKADAHPDEPYDALLEELERCKHERDEHLRLKNALVLKAYPAMDAVDRIRKWIDAQKYENDLITVAQLRELLGPPTPANHYEKSAPSAEF